MNMMITVIKFIIRTHMELKDGIERWKEYDDNGNLIHYKDSIVFERWKI